MQSSRTISCSMIVNVVLVEQVANAHGSKSNSLENNREEPRPWRPFWVCRRRIYEATCISPNIRRPLRLVRLSGLKSGHAAESLATRARRILTNFWGPGSLPKELTVVPSTLASRCTWRSSKGIRFDNASEISTSGWVLARKRTVTLKLA